MKYPKEMMANAAGTATTTAARCGMRLHFLHNRRTWLAVNQAMAGDWGKRAGRLRVLVLVRCGGGCCGACDVRCLLVRCNASEAWWCL